MNKSFWKNKIVVVTGGHGFLGTHLVSQLKQLSPQKIIIPRSDQYDLREKSDCTKVVKGADIVIHLAANVGGIGYNQKFPGTLFYDNLLMGVHLMEEARKAKVKKFVAIGTICAYPKFTPVPFKEIDLWNGYPEETNAPYGLAKKMMLVQSTAYRQQYGFNSIFLLPVNLYGPGDKFDLESSHVIPALIRKFVEAQAKKQPEVVVWGSGRPTREFLYVEDAAHAIILATEKYNSSDPVNIGSSFEISIKDLAQTIKKVVGYQGKVVFDKTKPDGQPKRKLSVIKAKHEFDFSSSTNFLDGLTRTVEWYKNTINLPSNKK
jgi:GDP-L-fucose synthase